MGKILSIANMHDNPDDAILARELVDAGYYKYVNALEVIAYWKGQGLTLNDIREEYHL